MCVCIFYLYIIYIVEMPNRNAMISKIWWDLSGNIVQISWGYHGILITRSLCPIVCPGSVPKIVLQIIWRELYHLFNLDNWDLLMILYHLFIGFVPPFLWFIVPSIPIKCWLFDDLGLVRPIPNFNLPGKKKDGAFFNTLSSGFVTVAVTWQSTMGRFSRCGDASCWDLWR